MELNQQLDLIGARGENNEWRIFGPPGCGKTTAVSRQIARAVAKFGAESVLVTSFSKAAATELIARDLPIPHDRIGTLHAHCYRALGRPPIAETKVTDWNEAYPQWTIGRATENDMDEPADDSATQDGEQLLAMSARWRNRKLPVTAWPNPEVRRFYDYWDKWKKSSGLLDFTDMLEQAAEKCPVAPGDPRVVFADEAQDFTRLQLDLVRKWGGYAEYFLTVGDDDQTIYSFTGATPDAFLKPELPAGQKIVLSQSYRVPQAVHARAMQWITRITHREKKTYLPTAEEGQVVRCHATFQDAFALMDAIREETAAGRTVMLLASCSYMLAAIRKELIERAIPFHNPYRVKRGDWNPLHCSRGVSAAERVIAFAKPHNSMGAYSQPWTAADYRKWADWVMAQGTFTHGNKSAAKALPPEAEITMDQLHEWLMPDAYDSLMNSIMNGTLPEHLQWWLGRVIKGNDKTAAYPVRIAVRHGMGALYERPKIIIGTIHSVKGGEADTVFLCPDISYAAYRNGWMGGGEEYDAIIRQFYVGMTRARHKLVICEASGQASVDL